jgi:hypothetical protein
MHITRERVSKISLSPYLSYATGWIMRVWRAEKLDGDFWREPGRVHMDGDVLNTVTRFVQMPVSQLELAKAILALDRVNAVEVTDVSGFGEVLYKDWP